MQTDQSKTQAVQAIRTAQYESAMPFRLLATVIDQKLPVSGTLTRRQINAIAAAIVCRAAADSIDFEQPLSLVEVQCCFDSWADQFRRCGMESVESDESTYLVRQVLASLGFAF